MIQVALCPSEIRRISAMDLSGVTAVVFDILRATSSIITGLASGVETIFPVGTVEAARNLKKIMPDVPLMMLTCYHSSAAEKEALASGITAVFSKPDGMQNLVWTARAVLSKSSASP